ncbi:MAG: glycoside hydrolase family 43 protein [Clostridiales bacterium]|nr:glycoside hydrolase family 43 protein [Clostridiales bacterium]
MNYNKLYSLLLIMLLVFSLSALGCQKQLSKEDSSPIANEALHTIEDEISDVGTLEKEDQEVTEKESAEYADVTYSRVSVHDPSVIKANGNYYIFGSHMAYAKSDDLMNWKTFRLNINTEYYYLMGDIWEDYIKTPTNPKLEENLWAPDVIYNKAMGKYCMYLSVNGDKFNSAIILLAAEDIEGPYEVIGPVVYSGFNRSTHPVEKTDVYQVLGEETDLTRYQSTKNTKLNAIDPCVRYDEEGKLWMAFGSWFGGIYMLKLDENTGLRDYAYTYLTEPNISDQYYGYKIAGGYEVSGEGAYIHKFGDNYFLFLSYGGLTREGGYQMRVFRSENITGPYVDELGQSSIYTKHENNLLNNIGIRLVGSYKFNGSTNIPAAQGHNSVLLDDDGKMFNVFHTRFAGGLGGNAEYHEVHVHQLFLNEEGWIVMAPYEYSGETISKTGYAMQELIGDYEFVIHTPTMYFQTGLGKQLGIAETLNITLNSDGNVVGEASGTWNYREGTPYMSITIDGISYEGVFLKQANETEHKLVMTFTALGNNITVMGSKK